LTARFDTLPEDETYPGGWRMVKTAEELQLASADGTRLAAYRWRAEPSRATMVLVHGYCDHARRCPELVEAALGRGFSVAAVDLRGHGQSAGKQGHVSSFTRYLEDVEALVREIEVDAGPMFLVGHSMGALVAIRYIQAGRHGEYLGLGLSSPYLGLAMELPAWKRLAGRMMTRVWPSLSMPTGIPIEALSRNPEVVRRTLEDKLYGRNATARAFTELLAAHQEAFEQVSTVQLPVLLLLAGSDSIVQPAASQRFFEALEVEDKRLVLLQPMYHEIFGDPDRGEVFEALFGWMERHLPSAGGA
jgi:alpha-beta hydrolase superfamily lysophospholipase